jgi:aminoglycoside phosphotransferase (APT) family kinase protein
MEVAREQDIPTPAVLAAGTYEGAPFMVMEWLPGGTMLDGVRHRPWQARRLGREFGRLQAKLHTIASDRLRPIADTDWIDRAEHAGLIAAVQSELAAAEPRFCHFDFHPLNVLHDGDRVTGLVDFTNASASDIRADLAMTHAVLVAAPLPPGAPGRAMNMLRRRFTLGWREGYLDFAGHFPLTPLFEALGYGIYHYEFASAIDEGRGWADSRDLQRLRVLRDEAMAKAGLGPTVI